MLSGVGGHDAGQAGPGEIGQVSCEFRAEHGALGAKPPVGGRADQPDDAVSPGGGRRRIVAGLLRGPTRSRPPPARPTRSDRLSIGSLVGRSRTCWWTTNRYELRVGLDEREVGRRSPRRPSARGCSSASIAARSFGSSCDGDAVAHGDVELGAVGEVPVDDGLAGAGLGRDLVHADARAVLADRDQGGLDQLFPAVPPVLVPPRVAPVAGLIRRARARASCDREYPIPLVPPLESAAVTRGGDAVPHDEAAQPDSRGAGCRPAGAVRRDRRRPAVGGSPAVRAGRPGGAAERTVRDHAAQPVGRQRPAGGRDGGPLPLGALRPRAGVGDPRGGGALEQRLRAVRARPARPARRVDRGGGGRGGRRLGRAPRGPRGACRPPGRPDPAPDAPT